MRGFWKPGLLRDKDVAEVGGEAAAGKAAGAAAGEAVGEDIEPAAQRGESLTELEGVGQRLGAVAEIVQILPIEGVGVDAGSRQLLKEFGKAGGQQLRAGDFTALKRRQSDWLICW